MTTNQAVRPALRASDAERERVVALIQAATGAGRLTADEAAERLSAVYATRFRHELHAFTEDLPSDDLPQPGRATPAVVWRGPLAVHATIAVALSALLIARWIASGVPFFWPAMPMMWLAVSVVVHARIRRYRVNRLPALRD
jgi:hypothetical protein